MKSLFTALAVLILAGSAKAGVGVTEVKCTGVGTKVDFALDESGASDFNIKANGAERNYANTSDLPDNKLPATSVIVVDSRKGVVVAVGLKIDGQFTSQQSEVVSIPTTYVSKGKSQRGPADGTFKATLSSDINGYKPITLSCKLHFDL